MLILPNQIRILIYNEITDLRKGFEGLSAIVDKHFSSPLTSGAYFVFLNRQKDRMKVLYWDEDGLAIWYKRLEKGRFQPESEKTLLSRKEFILLIEGITPKRIQKRFYLEKK